MIYEKVKIDDEVITLSGEENASIRVWVNRDETLDLPLVYNGQLTIELTRAGLAALEYELESLRRLRVTKVKEVEFQGND
ncbi:MAG: hypothetical protein K4571_15920 [Deltaproteobacteria bacterium]